MSAFSGSALAGVHTRSLLACLTLVLCAASARAQASLVQEPVVAHSAQSPGQSSPNQPRAAIERWREALELDLPAEILAEAPKLAAGGGPLEHDGEALALWARALSAAGEDERAQALLEQALPDPATSANIELARARLALEHDELERVLAMLRAPAGAKEFVRHPELAECWLLFGRASARAGENGLAVTAIEHFLALAPLDAEAPAAWHMLAQAAIGSGNFDRARTARDKAEESARWQSFYRTRRLQVREHPHEPLPRLGLAQLWMSVDQFERARSVLFALLDLAPDFARAWDLLGEAERKLGHASAARAAYDRAVACEPELVEARFNRGMLALLEQRTAQAQADFEWLVQSSAQADPRFLRAHLELARLLFANDPAAARARHAHYRELGGTEALQRD